MKKLAPIVNTASKVVLGFFFAAIFLIGIVGLTYYTLNRLLATMDELAEPNQKLKVLNELQGEIIQITQVSQAGADGDIRIQDSTVLSLEAKLDRLNELAADSLEQINIENIRINLSTLVSGYIDLYEVKKNLANRNFTQEALRKVDLGIKRRASNQELEPLQKFKPKDYLIGEANRDRAPKQDLQIADVQIGDSGLEEDKLIIYLRELQNQNSKNSNLSTPQTLDNILLNIREVIKRIYLEESSQRQTLATMEADLSLKQVEIISTIQNLVGILQRSALRESNSQHQSAYGLSYDVTLFLIVIVIFAIFGISLMISSILKEIKLNKRYQENLLASQRKSEELARSKQEFLANMSHEIRNPLHIIQGFRAVMEKSNLNEQQQAHLRMIGFASDTLMEIVDEVLDFSKLEAGKLKLEETAFDPFLLFGSIQNFFELKAMEKHLDFEWEMDLSTGQFLLGDQLRLKQILNNLLSNSFKFTSRGKILVLVSWGENVLTVEIMDTGIGMSPEVLKRVFEEFDQADTSISRRYGGTGLGLAIVQRLVNLMGGSIEAESTESLGTTMRVNLPMKISEEILETELKPRQTLNLDGKRILLVDDDAVGLRYLETVLSYFGAECACYNGGIQFREDFIAEDFDLAIIDIQMPEFSGFDVVRQLRATTTLEEIPILAMTANVFLEERENLRSAGFDEILFKPFQESVLIETLAKFFPKTLSQEVKTDLIMPSIENEAYELTDLRKFCMGDEQILQDILGELILQTRLDLHGLKDSFKAGDSSSILEVCHQLGSRLGQIKSPSGIIARKIETNLKMKNQNGLAELLEKLDLEVNSLLDQLAIEISVIDVSED
jgi:signal transduction histidine kinase/FixJ family two-component response regulator